jgi:hypothetical protein
MNQMTKVPIKFTRDNEFSVMCLDITLHDSLKNGISKTNTTLILDSQCEFRKIILEKIRNHNKQILKCLAIFYNVDCIEWNNKNLDYNFIEFKKKGKFTTKM